VLEPGEALTGGGPLVGVVGQLGVELADAAPQQLAALVEAGLAWSETGSSAGLKTAQEKAKSDKQGLWASTNPTPPWDFRKKA
jgi:hypothetical protein